MITGIIMASGFSKRMNRNKLILKFKGISIIEMVIKAIKESDVDNIILVYREDEIKEIGIKNGVKTIYNDKADLGQSESIRLGVEHSPIETKGYMFFVADQPFLDTCTINKLIDAFETERYPIVVPAYNGKKGNPVIFSARLKDELLSIHGDMGGRSIIRKRDGEVKTVNFSDGILGKDIDTWDEYIRWR